MTVGFTKVEASSVIRSCSARTDIVRPYVRSHSFKSPVQSERNVIIKRALDSEDISTVSDRHGDTVMINGEVTPLRFLNDSVFITYGKVIEATGLDISEATFRMVLTLFKDIKIGCRQRKTAVCSLDLK